MYVGGWEDIFHLLATLKIVAANRAGLGQSQEPGIPPVSPTLVAEI